MVELVDLFSRHFTGESGVIGEAGPFLRWATPKLHVKVIYGSRLLCGRAAAAGFVLRARRSEFV